MSVPIEAASAIGKSSGREHCHARPRGSLIPTASVTIHIVQPSSTNRITTIASFGRSLINGCVVQLVEPQLFGPWQDS